MCVCANGEDGKGQTAAEISKQQQQLLKVESSGDSPRTMLGAKDEIIVRTDDNYLSARFK